MLIHEQEMSKQVRIFPGEYYASDQRVMISTLLGSCVSACLYDPVKNVVGMNHFLLGNKRYARNIPVCLSEAGRYGIHAMELLINEMMKLGARREHLHAKAFGGGYLLQSRRTTDNFFCVGDVNCRFIREFLENERIILVAADLDGDAGRVIHFFSGDYSVRVRKIKKTLSNELVQEEKKFWQKSIELQDRTQPHPEIW